MRYRVGDVLDGYVLETECGSGAFGSVFLAKNRTLGQECALKILYKNGRQYEKELEGLKTYQQKCRHTNLMRVDHVGENDECIFYTMDAADNLHPGEEYTADTLGNRLKEKTRLSPDEILPMIRDLLDGLDAMHRAGILHRDIKPDNILWVNGRAMLGDIGLISNNLEASMAGTPGFISPRVWANKIFTPQDDLYALAMVMYCALNGTPPEDYPITGSMPLNDSAQRIIRIYNAVLNPNSAVRTVKDFQALFRELAKRKMPKLLIAVAVAVIATVGIGVWLRLPAKQTPPRAVPTPMRPPVAAKPTSAPTPKPPTPAPKPQAPKPKPQIVEDIRIMPGTVYELRLPPLPSPDSHGVDLTAEGARIQKLYAAKIAEVRSRYAEDARLAAEMPKIEQFFETVDAMWGFKNDGTHLALAPATEATYMMQTARTRMSREEFEKYYREQNRRSLEFLKRYSAEEQARILYYSARQDEQSFRAVVREDLPDTAENRSEWERGYKAWAECHARMLKARNDLLSGR